MADITPLEGKKRLKSLDEFDGPRFKLGASQRQQIHPFLLTLIGLMFGVALGVYLFL
jgi:hypothetical protein